MLWTPADGGPHELAFYRDGIVEGSMSLPWTDIDGGFTLPPRLRPVGERSIEVIADVGRRRYVIDVEARRVVDEQHLDRASGPEVVLVDGGVVVVRRDHVTWLYGPQGRIRVEGASRVASLDPLIMHGGLGMIRLNEDVLHAGRYGADRR